MHKVITAPDESKSVIIRLLDENINNKLDSYLKKINTDEMEIKINIFKTKKGLFDGSLKITNIGKIDNFKRTNFKNLDDLINHLFDKYKESLSK